MTKKQDNKESVKADSAKKDKHFKKRIGFEKFGIEVEFRKSDTVGEAEQEVYRDSEGRRVIHKKIDSKYFDLIERGEKTFEYRVADFECEPGDTLVLEEWEYEEKNGEKVARRSTGRWISKKVGYVERISELDWLDRPDVKADLEKYGAQIISLLDE